LLEEVFCLNSGKVTLVGVGVSSSELYSTLQSLQITPRHLLQIYATSSLSLKAGCLTGRISLSLVDFPASKLEEKSHEMLALPSLSLPTK
jgi:hypothetical protein